MPSSLDRIRTTLVVLCGLGVIGCGAAAPPAERSGAQAWPYLSGWSLSRDLASSRKVGAELRFRPGPSSARVRHAAIVDGMKCGPSASTISVAHVEVFADGHVVIVPAGIGVAPVLRRQGAYVRGGRCVYPLRTFEPTGLVALEFGPTRTLGQFFDLWGQPLDRNHVAGFHVGPRGGIAVFVQGVRWRGNPRSVSLSPHAQITVELGPHVPPHDRYMFPPPQALGR
jgi:hypothetical protein